jgi:hypothetical protein
MTPQLLTVLALALLIHGCASTYVEPSEGPRAKIRFVSYTSASYTNIRVDSYEAEDCKTGKAHVALAGVAISHHRQKLGMPLGNEFEDKNFTEIYINADRPYIVNMGMWLRGREPCYVTMTFEPMENQMYEASYRATSAGCWMEVNRIKNESGNYSLTPENTARNSAMQCKP